MKNNIIIGQYLFINALKNTIFFIKEQLNSFLFRYIDGEGGAEGDFLP